MASYGVSRLLAASGGGENIKFAEKSIRFARYGCANRPFYHIVVMMVSLPINKVYFS